MEWKVLKSDCTASLVVFLVAIPLENQTNFITATTLDVHSRWMQTDMMMQKWPAAVLEPVLKLTRT